MDEEAILIGRAQTGDRTAFSQLLRLHQGRVRSFLSRYVGSKDIVDDLAQDVFLNAFSSMSTFRREAPFAQWLLGIARNRALKHLRSEEYRQSSTGNLLEAALAGWRAQKALEASALEDHDPKLAGLRECVKKLPEHSAVLLQEYYVKGRPVREVARDLGKREGALKMILFRLRDVLRDCIERRRSALEPGS